MELEQDCPHRTVTIYVTAGRFAPPRRYWSCQDCGADFAPTRADLPRATAAVSNERARVLAREIIGNVNNYAEDDGELSYSAFGPLADRIAKAITTPRAAGETTVEAFTCLRRQFPDNCIELSSDAGDWFLLTRTERDGTCHELAEGATLADCMAQVRAATRTEAEGEKS